RGERREKVRTAKGGEKTRKGAEGEPRTRRRGDERGRGRRGKEGEEGEKGEKEGGEKGKGEKRKEEGRKTK
ncbi:hypothetical protein ACC848_45310, partial [Rhizobium johnstonii]